MAVGNQQPLEIAARVIRSETLAVIRRLSHYSLRHPGRGARHRRMSPKFPNRKLTLQNVKDFRSTHNQTAQGKRSASGFGVSGHCPDQVLGDRLRAGGGHKTFPVR